MQTLPFLYSAIVEDETSITGRRRVILRDDLPVDLPEIEAFDSEVRIRYQLAVVTNRQVRELRYDVLGDRIAVRQPFRDLISFDFDREFQKRPVVLSGLDAYMGCLKRSMTLEPLTWPSEVGVPRADGLLFLESDHERQKARAITASASLIQHRGEVFSLAIEPVIASRRKVNDRQYVESYGRMIERDVVDGWRHAHFSTYDDNSQSFPPLMRLSAFAEGDAYQIFDHFETEGDVGRLDLSFPEASANVYEILKFMRAEILLSRQTPEFPWHTAEVERRLSEALDLVASYENVDAPAPDPLVAGPLVVELVDWARKSTSRFASQFTTNGMAGLCDRFLQYWQARGERMAALETRATAPSASLPVEEDLVALSGWGR